MSRIKWNEQLKWTEENLEDLRLAGYAYIRQGKYDIALPFFETLCLVAPDSAYDAQTLGAIFLELNKPSKALKYLDRALQIEGDHAPTLLNLTKALFLLGKKEEGLKLAVLLARDTDVRISNPAKALILAHE